MAANTEDVSPLIAFTDGLSWAVIYPYKSEHGLWEYHPMPKVDCAIVDYTGVEEADGVIQQAKSSPAGFDNIKGLIDALAMKGCMICYPPHILLVENGCALLVS